MKLSESRLEICGRELIPIVQGGMGVDISTAALALEVARLGGVGHISDAMAPFVCDRSFGTHYQAEKGKQFRHLTETINKKGVVWSSDAVYEANKLYADRVMTSKRGNGLIAMNVMEKLTMGAPTETLTARLKGALDGGIEAITLSAGLHSGSLKLIEDHPRFRDAAIGIIVSSARALKIFLRSASRVERLPDYIVVEGPLAGGHLGFGPDWQQFDLARIVCEVLEELKQNEISIPVIPAGGIFTGEDAAAFLRLGASGVQVATRFAIAQECGLPARVKQEYLKAKLEDVVVNSLSPTGYLMRMLKSSPCIGSSIKPNCESLGYMLDKEGRCQYHDAYSQAPMRDDGSKGPVCDKMCICHHFMSYSCYTCGHNVYRLKDTVEKLADGTYKLPTAEEVFLDYAFGSEERKRMDRGESAGITKQN